MHRWDYIRIKFREKVFGMVLKEYKKGSTNTCKAI